MKKLFLIPVLAGLLGGCATEFNVDMRPETTKDATPTAVVWSNENNVALEAATAENVIAAIPADETAARALLAKLKTAYATDPYTLTQMAAVSQWVMRPGRDAARKIWIAALLKTAENARDGYVKMACLDQLRWCGDEAAVARINAIGARADKAVRDFAEMVARELTGRSIGL